jgi:hypothetical protein
MYIFCRLYMDSSDQPRRVTPDVEDGQLTYLIRAGKEEA